MRRFLGGTKPQEQRPESAEQEAEQDDLTAIEDPSVRAQVEARAALLRGGRAHVEKRRTELYRQREEKKHGPMGERWSADLATQVELVSLTSIKPDPNFANMRLPATEEEIAFLAESINVEGIKVPITVVPSVLHRGIFHVRAGFRRTEAVRKLRWKTIPAIVLAPDIPAVTEHWINVIENATRNRLSTYELARAAQTMRDKFGVRPREFAVKAGISETYAFQLLRAIDRLPPELVENWKDKDPIPFSYLYQWSGLNHDEAIRQSQIYANRHPKLIGHWQPPRRRILQDVKSATSHGLLRMKKLRFQIECSQKLNENERELALQVIDYCTGANIVVDRVNEVSAKKRVQGLLKKRREEETESALTTLDVENLDPAVLEARTLAFHQLKAEEATRALYDTVTQLQVFKDKVK